MKRSEAFKQIAKEAGRNPNTVAVNYYYVAKKPGAKPAKRGPGRPRLVATRACNGAGSSRIEVALRSLADLIRSQKDELASLRRDNQRFATLRRLIR
jgi:hypothetical protein